MIAKLEVYESLTVSEFANAALAAGTTPCELLVRLGDLRVASTPGE